MGRGFVAGPGAIGQEKMVLTKRGQIQTGYKEDIFKMRVVKPWQRLPRGVVDAPSLETFTARLDGALSNLTQLKMSLLTAGVGPDGL